VRQRGISFPKPWQLPPIPGRSQASKAWLTNPEEVVPGQEMNYYLTEAQDREDVVAYLASVSKPARK